MKIYVGNLSYQTTADTLRSEFEKFGAVKTVDIIIDRETGNSKGFGFVEMPDNAEAQKAIEAWDNQELEGRPLRVNEARPRQPRPNGGRFGGPRRDY